MKNVLAGWASSPETRKDEAWFLKHRKTNIRHRPTTGEELDMLALASPMLRMLCKGLEIVAPKVNAKVHLMVYALSKNIRIRIPILSYKDGSYGYWWADPDGSMKESDQADVLDLVDEILKESEVRGIPGHRAIAVGENEELDTCVKCEREWVSGDVVFIFEGELPSGACEDCTLERVEYGCGGNIVGVAVFIQEEHSQGDMPDHVIERLEETRELVDYMFDAAQAALVDKRVPMKRPDSAR